MRMVTLVCLVGIVLALNCMASPAGGFEGYLRDGRLDVEGGGLVIYHAYEGEEKPGLGLGFAQLKYEAPDLYGFRWGLWWFGLKKIWEHNEGDFDRVCVTDNNLRELYASWEIPSTRTRLQAGRFYMRHTAMDGNSHQGAEVIVEDIPRLRLQAGAINRWSKYNRVHMNFQGMTGWQDASSVHEQAGDIFWFGACRVDLGKTGHIEPFFRYQERVMLLQGIEWDVGANLADGRRVGFDGIAVLHGNKWPEQLEPDYEDVYSWLLHGYYQPAEHLRFGAGWHGVSKDRGDLGVGLFFWIDPMTVDVTIPYDDHNHAQLYYADAKLGFDRLDLTLRYGYGICKPLNVYSHEVNMLAYYSITPSLTLGGIVSANRYSGDRLPNYVRAGAIVTVAY